MTSVEYEEYLKKERLRIRLEKFCKCERIISDSDIAEFAEPSKFYSDEDEIISVKSLPAEDDLVSERLKLSHLLDLPEDTHSLTKIVTNLPRCLKYSFRSGTTHMNMKKFSPLSRGYQGPAIAVAAIATSHLVKPNCWDERIIDRVIEDGDTYYCDSYARIDTEDRRTLKLLDLKRDLEVCRSHRIRVRIDEPMVVGTFRSETPKDLHIAKALHKFFQRYDAGVLTSPILNVGIWRAAKFFNLFDAQPRLENCELADPEDSEACAKLILLQSISDVLFIILEKSNVENEPFLLYGIDIEDAKKLDELPRGDEKSLGEPKRRPGTYRVQDKFRAVVQGSYHLEHPVLPEEFRGRAHLVLAVAALVYSRILSASKWTKVMIDLIFNQCNIYLADLARVLGKSFDDSFQLRVSDLLCDVVLGVYTAKIQLRENVIPGEGKKTKATIDTGLREFFTASSQAIIEIKSVFYAIWKEKNKYYMLDPFACDSEGFRVDKTDPDNARSYEKAAASVTMNSSIDQLVETILENTESKEKDPFFIHGLKVLYIKTASSPDGSDEKLIYRENKTKQRPPPPPSPPSAPVDDCEVVADYSTPRPRLDDNQPVNAFAQYPRCMSQVDIFMPTFQQDVREVLNQEANEENKARPDSRSPKKEALHTKIKIKPSGYKIVNPHRLTLRGTRNCLSPEFPEVMRGRQGLVLALVAVAESLKTCLTTWLSTHVDKILTDGHAIYEKLTSWILAGYSDDPFKEDDRDTMLDEEIPTNQQDHTQDAQSETMKRVFETTNIMVVDNMDLSMLPDQLKIGDTYVNFLSKMNILEGEANPLANLGEALEKYFEETEQVLLANNKLIFAIWKTYDKFYIFNPYGNDQEGWLNAAEPAALFVTDTIIELVNLLYSLLQFNEYNFTLHFINLSLSSEQDNTVQAVLEVEISESPEIPHVNILQKYKTKFLPVTDSDLEEIKVIDPETIVFDSASETDIHPVNQASLQTKPDNFDDKSIKTDISRRTNVSITEAKIVNVFDAIKEPKQLDAPARLNLALVTGIVKIERLTDETKQEKSIDVFYEKLKYTHPPPFVLPPKKNLCALLDVKLASKSVPSLLSRFSIDSKLGIKEKNNVSSSAQQDVIISLYDTIEKSKLITLPPKKYFYSKSLPTGLTPIRAINEQFIQDKIIDEEKEEECRRKKKDKEIEMVPECKPNLPKELILPTIIPLGPCIKTPDPIRKPQDCPEKKKRKCPLTAKQQEDSMLKKLVCSTEDLLLQLIFPDFKEKEKEKNDGEMSCLETKSADSCSVKPCEEESQECEEPEACGFKPTADEKIGIISANTFLEDRNCSEEEHYRSCYFAAIVAILAKINVSVRLFHSGVLDQFIESAKKIGKGTGKLRHKLTRWFRNFNILGVKYNVVVKQIYYANPEIHEPDALKTVMKSFLRKYQTGILVFANIAYAFWFANGAFYLFDPYACDDNGLASEGGSGACLMQICDFDIFLERIVANTGEAANKAYRLYTVLIAHLEAEVEKKKCKEKKNIEDKCEDPCKKPECEEDTCEEVEECKSETSLIELSDWVNKDKSKVLPADSTLPGFLPIKNYNASALEVKILENKITKPIQAPFISDICVNKARSQPYDRVFHNNSILSETMDLCVMAWSQIHDPTVWSTKTIQALFQACVEFTYDSLLAAEDTTTPEMTDRLLNEFNIANYNFRVVFAPMHQGILYTNTGWNLAMTLDKIFMSPVYTGAVVACGNMTLGVMKKEERMFAWWLVQSTKKIRIIVSDDMEDYLKLIVKEFGCPEETEFFVRIVTISYAKILGPNCSDIEGLHEAMVPSTSIAEIHLKDTKDRNNEALFRCMDKSRTPIFILGSVALLERDKLTEPKVKRCYFVALFATILRRDIIQNPLSEMIDKILELAETSYKLFQEPKYHKEHILKDIRLMDRVFEIRDCASNLTSLQDKDKTTREMFFPALLNQLKEFFKKYTSGILQFSNCCYGFWYSASTKCYYYLDPYPCNIGGRKDCKNGKSCLCVFSSIFCLAKQMFVNQYEETTGFFIHRVHVELVDESPCEKFQEDPIWIYLDYHWSYRHLGKRKQRISDAKSIGKVKTRKSKKNKKEQVGEEAAKKPSWKKYLIEVPNTIYSMWGTLSSFDIKYGSHAGKNQAAIGVALFAMCDLHRPSEWSAAVLDSAVICGDCYYKDSQKVIISECNRFNLTKCLKLPPYRWLVEFKPDLCGLLYGSKTEPNLVEILERALERSSNLLLHCGEKILTILQTTEAFYVMDSSWIGPPLFAKNRGAIYTLRCKNSKTLTYILTKILNTNQQLEFTITPVIMVFSQETCQSTDKKPKINCKKILNRPARSEPGKTVAYTDLVNGSVVVPEEDSYLCYSRNLKLGLAHGAEFESAPSPHDECKKSVSASLKKKKVCGQRNSSQNSSISRKSSETAPRFKFQFDGSIPSILTRKIECPRVLNLIRSALPSKTDRCDVKALPAVHKSRKETEFNKMPSKILDVGYSKMIAKPKHDIQPECEDGNRFAITSSFILDENRYTFEDYNTELQREVYQTYKHGNDEQFGNELLDNETGKSTTSEDVNSPPEETS